MDIEQAISILQTESANLGVELGRQTSLMNAINLAVKQLEGKLETQLADLVTTKEQLDEAQAQIAALTEPAVEPAP